MEVGQFVFDFSQVNESHASLVGGKGLRLAQMAQKDLPVLPGFCITTAAYRAFVAHNGLQSAIAGGDAAAIRGYLLGQQQGELPAAVTEAILAAYKQLGRPVVAVRSSATAEDSFEASFAGQYDTFLNVSGGAAVLEKMRACWAALWSERALAYIRERGLDPLQVDMGVVVQRQGNPQAAGVLFTLNPLNGCEDELMVEAAWGMGEAVVSGRVTPDRYVVNARARKVLNRDISNQSVVLVADAGGAMQEVPLPPEQRDRSVLADGQLFELAELGYRVQAIYGYPQDIEWALLEDGFVLLQTRPLTSFNFDPNLGQWTSGNYREILPGFASPLALSLSLEHDYGRALSEFFREIKLGDAPPATVWGKAFFGRAYWNVGVTKQLAAKLPGFKERVFDETVGIEPTYSGDGLVTPWAPGTILRALPVLIAVRRKFNRVWREARAYRDCFLTEVEPALDAVQPAGLSDAELATCCRQMHELHWRANGLAIRVSMLSTQAQDDFEPMVRHLNLTLPAGERVAEGDLITGLSDVRTAQPALELWQLGRAALADPAVAAAVTQGDPATMPERLKATETGRQFWQQVQDYLARYRYMAPIDEDLVQLRWDEDAGFVLSTLQAYATSDAADDPNRRLEAQRQVRRATERRVLRLLSRSWRQLWPFGRRGFTNQLRLVRRYVWWREETRVIASRAFYQCRRFFKELGRRWAESGVLDQEPDVFLLRWPAIRAVLDGEALSTDLRRQVAEYQRTRALYLNFEPPGVIGRGASLPHPADQSRLGQKVFNGIPCSSGQIEGMARVVETLEEARALQRGEILVARYTNPGWTPLFNLAGGIIIEEGGLLSHGAVVAREYGIPAVLRIEGATKMFHTGQRLRVDGSSGIVEVL